MTLTTVKGHLNHSSLNISETVRHIDYQYLVPKNRQYEVAYGHSNAHVTGGVT